MAYDDVAAGTLLQNSTSASHWLSLALQNINLNLTALPPIISKPLNMPSISTLLRTSFLTVQAVLATTLQSPVRRFSTIDLAASESCPHPQLSCHNTTVVKNLCCFNAPGGSLLQTQFWDTNPVTGPEDSWTIHGLWVSSRPVRIYLYDATGKERQAPRLPIHMKAF